jgi:hypothetical protein
MLNVIQALLFARHHDPDIAEFCMGIFQIDTPISVLEYHEQSLTQLITEFNKLFISSGRCAWQLLELSNSVSYPNVSLINTPDTIWGHVEMIVYL